MKIAEEAFNKAKDNEGLKKFKSRSTLETIEKGVKEKFDQNKELKEKLLETKGKKLDTNQT